MNYVPDYMLAGIAADKTAVMTSGDTYIGDYDREAYAKAQQDPSCPDVEELPIWKIKKISVTELDGGQLYEAKYPDGNANFYGYKWSEAQSLSYKFANSK